MALKAFKNIKLFNFSLVYQLLLHIVFVKSLEGGVVGYVREQKRYVGYGTCTS